jgi:hypothetical protein
LKKHAANGKNEERKFAINVKANCPMPRCMAPKAPCKSIPDKSLGSTGCPKYPCGRIECPKASVCMFSKVFKSTPVPTGFNNSTPIVTYTNGRPVTDVAKQCPGDRF